MSRARVSVVIGSVLALVPEIAAGQGPQIAHDAVGCVVAGQFPRFDARIEPLENVSRARVHFRAEGSSAWYFVEMKAAAGTWSGVLPKPTPALKRFSYYLEATGTAFEASRTQEYAPRVVGARSECETRVIVAAVSAVGPAFVGAPAGAPALPLGFTGSAPAPVAAAGGSAAAGGGSSSRLVLGLVGGAAAVGGVVALAAGGSGSDAASGGPASSPGASSGSGGAGGPAGTRVPQSLILALSNDCALSGGVAIYAGDTVRVARGMCAWNTVPEAQAACAGQTAALTVDGAPLAPVDYAIGYLGGNGLVCSSAEADWKAIAGHHVAAGIWTIPGSPLHSCAVDVQP